MEFEDLDKFLIIAASSNLQQAAELCHVTPSALSKSLRRLETSLECNLFDRRGRQLLLNTNGKKLQQRAAALVNNAKQLKSELRGHQAAFTCRIAGPSVLQQRWLPMVLQQLNQLSPTAWLETRAVFEDMALMQLQQGEVDIALITSDALHNRAGSDLQALNLGEITFEVAAAPDHPLCHNQHIADNQLTVTSQQLEHHGFACPASSLFRGQSQGPGSDGWHDEAIARRIQYRVDDYALLLTLVKNGQALAYMPDFLRREVGAVRVHVSDCTYHCIEQVYLLYRPSEASGWLNQLIYQLGSSVTSV